MDEPRQNAFGRCETRQELVSHHRLTCTSIGHKIRRTF